MTSAAGAGSVGGGWLRATRRFWESGPWRLELREDELADVTFRGRTVLRSIRAVVRDHDWNTAAWIVTVTRTDEGDDLTLTLRTAGSLGCDVSGTLRVTATDAFLTVRLDAVAETGFDTNRTGLVVLHPPGLAGGDLAVTHPDGTTDRTCFPASISPHQPAVDIAGLAWAHDGLQVGMALSGDVFEMEDQRNWTDASYKTYSRPLALPFPYRLEAGQRVQQEIVVTASEADADPAGRSSGRTGGRAAGRGAPALAVVELVPGGLFPAIGLGASTAPGPAPSVPAAGSEVLVELDLASPSWRAALRRAAASDLALDVRFVLDERDPGSIHAGAAALTGLPLARVAAFRAEGPARHVSDAEATALLREALGAAEVHTAVVGGARSHFTELNREIARLPADLDGVVFSVTPLFHSLDTEQSIESLGIQRLVARQAVRLAEGRPLHIGPVTLLPRFNDVATAPASHPPATDPRTGDGSTMQAAADPRQSAPELAAWTIASAAALAIPGVETLVFFEEWGPRGIRTADGADLPVAGAVRALAPLSGSPLLSGESPDGLVWAIGAATDAETVALAANLDRLPRALTVRSASGTAHVNLAPGDWARLTLIP